MFANAIRIQARTALASTTKAAVTRSIVAAAGSVATRSALVSRLAVVAFSSSRPLSTSAILLQDGGRGGFTTRAPSPPSSTLFIGNLPFSVEESDLRDKFEPYGAIRSIRLGEPIPRIFMLEKTLTLTPYLC